MIPRATLARDANGSVVLTVEQAELVARILAHDWAPSSDTPEDAIWWAFFDIEGQSPDGCLLPGNKADALARWVLRWAPVVRAAIRQHDAGEAMMDAEDDVDSDRAYSDACVATECAVRDALEDGGAA